MCPLLIAGAGIIIIMAMLLFHATGPEVEDNLRPAQLESSANFGRSELVTGRPERCAANRPKPEINLEQPEEMLGMLNWEVVPSQEESYQFHNSSIVTGLQ